MADINKLKNKARREEQRENWSRAIELYKKALLESERERDGAADLSLFNRIGDIHLRLGDKKQAVQFYEQAIQRYADQELHTSAIALCNKVLRILPDRIEILRQLGSLQATAGLAAEARGNYLRFASEMVKARRTDRALEALEECVEVTGDQGAALRLASLFVELERRDEAVERLEALSARLRERGAAVDRIESLLSELGGETADAAQREVAAVPEEGVQQDSPSEGLDAVQAVSDQEAELAEIDASTQGAREPERTEPHTTEPTSTEPLAAEPISTEPHAAQPTSTTPPSTAPDFESVDETSGTTHVPARTVGPAASVHFHPEPVELVATRRAPADVPGTSWREAPDHGTAVPPTPASHLVERGAKAERLEEPREGPGVSVAWQGAGPPAAEPAERHPAPALWEALLAVPRHLFSAGNGSLHRSSGDADPSTRRFLRGTGRRSPRRDVSEGPGGAGWATHSPDRWHGSRSPAAMPAPDHPEPDLRGPVSEPRPNLPVERREDGVPSFASSSPATEALLWRPESVEPGAAHGGEQLVERALAAREEGQLEAAIDVLEVALESPGVFADAYELLRECRKELAARTEVAPAPEVQVAPEIEVVDAPQDEAAPEVQAAPEAEVAPEAEKAGSGAVTNEVEAVKVEPEGAPDEVEVVEAVRPTGEADGGRETPRAGTAPTPEFRQWVRSAPPGLLERSLRELRARGEVARAAVVSERLLELTPSGGSSDGVELAGGVKEHDSGEPSRRPSAEGDTMLYGSEGIEPTRGVPGAGSTELLEVDGKRPASDGPLPYDSLAGDAPAVDFEELLSELKTSLADSDSAPDTRSRTELGAELKGMGLLDEAIRELQAAVREPNCPAQAYELLGEAFIEKGQPRIAARLLSAAVVERDFGDRESLGVLYQLGLAYEGVGDRPNALDCYERIFSVDIDYRDIKERIVACGD